LKKFTKNNNYKSKNKRNKNNKYNNFEIIMETINLNKVDKYNYTTLFEKNFYIENIIKEFNKFEITKYNKLNNENIKNKIDINNTYNIEVSKNLKFIKFYNNNYKRKRRYISIKKDNNKVELEPNLSNFKKIRLKES